MRIVVVHNRYRSTNPSGENRVVDDDVAELTAAGHHVVPYVRDSDDVVGAGPLVQASLAVRPTVSPIDVAAFSRLLSDVDPHVVHLHNPYPMISPWVVRTASRRRIPVVQTVHNYRHACVNGVHFRDGARCTECLDTAWPWPAVRHGCYQGSSLASAPMAVAQVVHRRTWDLVDRFLPVGDAVADHLRALGIPDERITVRPNEVSDPGPAGPPGRGVLFAGRLSDEKGIGLLLEAWGRGGFGTVSTLTIAGDGEHRDDVVAAADRDPSISYVGFLDRAGLDAAYRACAVVVVPSQCAEADPIAAVTALAHGRAVVATDLGALPIVVGGGCGWVGSATPDALASAIRDALASPDELAERGDAARRRFLATRSRGSRPSLEEIYERETAKLRGSIVVVGPDGAGKSAVVARLAADARSEGTSVTTAHFRPGIAIPAAADTVPEVVAAPQSQVERRPAAAILRSCLVWADFLVGWFGPWRRAATRGLLLLERPFVDQVVDPRRYRLPSAALAPVRRMARLLPRADLAVLLDGDPVEMHRRKPELDRDEVERQLHAWRRWLTLAGRRTAEVPSVGVAMESTVAAVRAAARAGAVGASPDAWCRPLLHPARLDLRVTSQPPALAASRIHAPQKRVAAIAAGTGRLLTLAGTAHRADPPPIPVDDLLADLGLPRHGLVAMRSSTVGRWIVGVEWNGRLTHVVKIGPGDDLRLHDETAALERLQEPSPGWRAPRLVVGLTWRGRHVLVTEALGLRPRSGVTVAEAADIATDLTLGTADRPPLVHGDFAPWNVRRLHDDSLVVVDWERCSTGPRPMVDLAHFVVSQAVLVGNRSPEQAARLLVDPGSPGAAHIARVAPDRSPKSAVLDALDELSWPDHPRSGRFVRRMRALL